MRKVVVHRAGSYERLEIEEHPVPEPGPEELLVAVEAIGVNYADCIVRMGLYRSAKEYVGWPITPGFEVAGRVTAVGAAVEDIAVGARVFGVTRFGAYASHVLLPRRQVYDIPDGFSVEQAAAFPAVFLTASYALFELGSPRSGQSVLVHSAAGGVGSALVQLCKIAGCRVVGVVGGAHKVAHVRELGADVIIDKSNEDLWRASERCAPEGYALVFDANGVATLKQSYAHLARPGRLIVYGFHTMMPRRGGRPNWIKLAFDYLRTPRFDPLTMTNENRSVLAFNLSYLFEAQELFTEHMERLVGWIEQGAIKAPVVTPYQLEDVAKAHAALESGVTIGKLVLIP